MIDVLSLTQQTLDAALPLVHSYWQRKSDSDTSNEYIVYTHDNDVATYADGLPILRNANVTVKYYYQDTLLDTSAGRAAIKLRKSVIVNALQAAGFSVPFGAADVGDIDDIGFGTAIIECYFGRVV